MKTEKNNLIKKIIYRSRKRGFLESEIILEKFISFILPKMNNEELISIDRLLSYDDPQIINWINKKEIPPQELKQILQNITDIISA